MAEAKANATSAADAAAMNFQFEEGKAKPQSSSSLLKILAGITFVGIGIGIAFAATTHKQEMNNGATDILQSFQSEEVVRLRVSGTDRFGMTNTSRIVYHVTALLKKTKGGDFTVDAIAEYRDQNHSYHFRYVNQSAFYQQTALNLSKVSTARCLSIHELPPLHTLATSILEAKVIPSSEIPYLECTGGKIVKMKWSAQEFAYCTGAPGMEEGRIGDFTGFGFAGETEYFTDEASIAQVKELMNIPLLNANSTPLSCPKIDLEKYFKPSSATRRSLKANIVWDQSSANAEASQTNGFTEFGSTVLDLGTYDDDYFGYDNFYNSADYSADYDSAGSSATANLRRLLLQDAAELQNMEDEGNLHAHDARRLSELERGLRELEAASSDSSDDAFDCLFLHGMGVTPPQSSVKISRQSSYFGKFHHDMCRKVRYLEYDSWNTAWNDLNLAKSVCHVMKQSYTDLGNGFQNVVFIAHGTGGLVLAQALSVGGCKRGPFSRIITMQVPLRSTPFPLYAYNKCPSTKRNEKKFTTTNRNSRSMFEYATCAKDPLAPSIYGLYSDGGLKDAALSDSFLNAEAYLRANRLGAMCGDSPRGILGGRANDFVEEMHTVSGTKASGYDGVVSWKSCTGGDSSKKYRSNPFEAFYRGAVNHVDGTLNSGDSFTDVRQMPSFWLNSALTKAYTSITGKTQEVKLNKKNMSKDTYKEMKKLLKADKKQQKMYEDLRKEQAKAWESAQGDSSDSSD